MSIHIRMGFGEHAAKSTLYVWRIEDIPADHTIPLTYYVSDARPGTLEVVEDRTLAGDSVVYYAGADVVTFTHPYSDSLELCCTRAMIAWTTRNI